MNILLIRSTSAISGSEIHNLNLCMSIKKHEDAYIHVISNYFPFITRLRKHDIPATYIFSPLLEIGVKKDILWAFFWYIPLIFTYLLLLIRMRSKISFDVILLESMTEKLLLTPYLKLFNYPVIWIEQGSLFNTRRSIIVKKIYLYMSILANKILAVSLDTKNDLVLGGVNPLKVIVVYIGVQNNMRSLLNSRLNIDESNIGFLGNISSEKGITSFMDIGFSLTKMFPKIYFTIIGSGPMYKDLVQFIKVNNLRKRFILTGFVDEVSVYLNEVDILFFPSFHNEGLSLALLEALSMGKIVVARDVGGNRELIIDKKTGFLFKTDEEAEKILIDILSGKTPTKEIRLAALEHVRKNFNMDTQLPKFLKAFHD